MSLTISAAFALALGLAACGSSSSSGSNTTTTTAAAETTTSTTVAGGSSATTSATCANLSALKDSVASLASADTIKNGAAGFQAALDKVKQNADALKSSVSAANQADVQSLEDSLTSLQTAISNVSSSGVGGIVSAAKDVATSAATLISKLQAGC
jgi:hypothetical protein